MLWLWNPTFNFHNRKPQLKFRDHSLNGLCLPLESVNFIHHICHVAVMDKIISLSKEISLFYLGKLNCVLDTADEVRCAKIFGDSFNR